MVNILLIGNGAREHALAEALVRSSEKPRLFACMKANNPGLAALAERTLIGPYHDLAAIVAFAREGR
ncbi:MAG TPA: phosphoribosylamine--glycine ligase, partial [Syntrophus sp. (in: bacteria)]|nr:phosphoribosylamine--glycine ligase [Syntrophus sp. (in: bacteria)]